MKRFTNILVSITYFLYYCTKFEKHEELNPVFYKKTSDFRNRIR